MQGELGKKSKPQMGFKNTTHRDLVRCSNHWAAGDSVVGKGQYTIFLMQIFFLPQSFVGVKNCKSSELIRQNVSEQLYVAPREARNWQEFAWEKWRILGLVWNRIARLHSQVWPNTL